MTNELKAKLLAAKSAEEAAALVKAAGQELTEEEAAKLWEEIERVSDGRQLSKDELGVVSGGSRNWITEGCAATVEDGSSCWGTDACSGINVHYELFNAESKCPNYTGPHKDEVVECVSGSVYGIPVYTTTYRCKYCGRTHQETGVSPPNMPPMGGPGLIIMD